MSELESRKSVFLNKIKPFFKNPYKIASVGVLLLALILRLYYLDVGLEQAAWWDAADYLSSAKIIGGKLATSGGYDWTATRPIFLGLMWGMFFRLGLGEWSLHLSEIFFAVLGTLFVYLLGKEYYDKKVGLIAALIFSVFYLHLFYTIRLMSDVPAIAMWFGSAYFFYKGFVKEEGNKFKILSAIFLSAALFMRAATIFEIPVFGLWLLVTKKFKFLKDKYFWYSILAAFLVFLPNLISIMIIHGGNPVFKFLGIGAGRFASASGWPHWSVFFTWLYMLPASMGWQFFIPFLFGLYIFFEMFLGFDFILKGKTEGKKLLPALLMLIWIIVPFTYHTLYAGSTLDERYFFYIYPPLFIISAQGFMIIYKILNKAITSAIKWKHIKYLTSILIILIIASGAYAQIQRGDLLIKNKQSSYYPVKLAGLWIKENSNPEDIIISGSRYQNIYYSERDTYNFALENYADRDLIFKETAEQNIPREMHGYLTEETFDKLISKLKPRFMAVSIFESHPPWAYTYADRHPNVKPVQGYLADNSQQPVLIIYEFNWNKKGVDIPEPVFALTGEE
ncbi:MAG: glycosyltransferase family 39 protein [Candidatus Nanoarchaeia archaeon]|nr:glycosyltransferase family 39 protein [Candidatus Nanoarchaeia archaeon]